MGIRPRNVIGTRIKELRCLGNITREELARACRLNGTTITAKDLEEIELEKRSISDQELVALSFALKVPVKDIFPLNTTTRIRMLSRK